MQKNWIGRSVGAEVQFVIEGRDEPVTVYTTRPDTLYGATFFVVAADSDLAAELAAGTPAEAEFAAYLETVKQVSEMDRLDSSRAKTGVFLQRYAINPVNGERIPVWASDYVLADYGTGAIMAVPAHDQRDLDFARTFGLPVRVVVDAGEDPAVDRRRDRRRRAARELRAARRPRQGRGHRRDPGRSCWSAAPAGRRSTTGCATGSSRASGTGARRSRSSTARPAARCPFPTTSCPSRCRRPRAWT